MAAAREQRLLNKELDKRAVIKLDKSIKRDDEGYHGLMTFGKDNNYPQFMERVINSSVTAKLAADSYAEFLSGDGFENEDINKIVVGTDSRGKKITLRRLLAQVARSVSRNKGSYIHVNPTLEGKVDTVFVTPFKNCRYSKPDDVGYSAKILVYDNWEKDGDKGKYNKNDIKSYHVFNLDKTVIASEVKDAGGIKKYKGQKYIIALDDEFLYPLSTFDTVYLDCDTESQLSIYDNNECRNGFTEKTIARVQAETEEAYKEIKTKLINMMGNDGDNLMVISDQLDSDGEISGETGIVTEKIGSTINPDQFDGWDLRIPNRIRKAAKVPGILIDYEQGKLGNTSGEALTQATVYYNAIVNNDRVALEEAFEEIFSNSVNETLANNTNWKIKSFNPIKKINNGTTDTSTAASGKVD